MLKSIKEFRKIIMCCSYDDEVWSLVKAALRIGTPEVKELASKLQGMDVDQAQNYLRQHP